MMQAALIQNTTNLPPGFPDYLLGQSVVFDLPKQIKQRLRRPEKIKVSEWAEKYRVVTDGAHEGPWRHDYAPHTVKIMDTFGLPWVREVWFCGVEQSGKTNTMINCIGWCIDCDPGNIFYLMPTEDTAAKVTGGKLRPTLQKSPRLARYVSSKQDDTTLSRINLTHGVTIFPAHANSASSMATWAAKHCFGDEVDKYPPMAGKETDPITLIKKRNRTYKGRYKRFFSSTPAGLFVYKGMQNCHQVYEFRIKCPECGEYIHMDIDHLIIPPDCTAEQAELSGIAYACNACGCELGDNARERAIRSGRWVCTKGEDIPRPSKVGFHHRAWECLDITLAEIAAAWLKAKTGGHAEKVAWANGYEAIDYQAETSSRPADAILTLRDDRPRGLVPRDISCLSIAIDTQMHGFWYEVRAWGYGLELESWQVREGFAETFEALDQIIWRDQYKDVDGNIYPIIGGCIDSGGGMGDNGVSRTTEVYNWCRQRRNILPIKGQQRMSKLYSVSAQDHFPGTTKKIPGGLDLYLINVTLLKDSLNYKLHIHPTDPGAWHLHTECTEDYARQMTAEYKDERGYWECPKGKPNHYWDVSVYHLAFAEIAQIKFTAKPGEVARTDKKIKTSTDRRRW